MPSIDQCDGASALTALPSTLEIFDKFKSVSENGKLSDSEESFHLLLDDDETENQSNGGTHNDETEDDILNKFETNTPESDLRAEESFLNDEEEQCSSKIKLKTIVKISSKDENYCESPEGEFKSLYEDEVEPDPASTPTSEPTMEVTEETNGDNTSEDSMGMEEENNIANLIDKLEEDDKEEEEKPVENGTPMEQDSCDIDEATEPEKQEMTEDDREEATPLKTAKDDTPEEELKNDETALESDAKDQESSDEKPLEKDPLADDQVFKVPEELPKEPQESDDKSNDRTEDESDLLDVTMVRETEEDDACAMADAMTDIETRTSEKSDEEQSEDRMDTEQETSDNDKDFDDNAMSFDGMDEDSHTSSSSQTKQENKVVEETSDTSNNAVEEELPAEVEAVAPDKPEEEKQEEIGEEMAVEPPSANENDEDRLVIKEKEQCEKETSEKSDKVVLVDNKKTEEVTKEGAKDEGERVENAEKTDQNVPETNQISLNKRAHLSIEEEPEEEVQIPKKPKLVTEITPAAPPPSTLDKLKVLSDFAKFMQCKKLTSKLTRSDLEQFCIQKICESLMLKSTEGELHQMIRKQEKIIESLRKDLVQLSKQCKDLDIVNKKLMSEIRNPNAPKRPLVPLKITRSVGLQVRLNPGSDPSQNRNKRTSIGGGVTPTNTTSNTPQKQQTPSPVVNRKVAAPTQSTVGAQQASVVRQVGFFFFD
ncbi:FK506-binding protein 5 [Anthonomus grandis grandis]|uniref:FK506-binding protein 5 n=1 Tax=Anthonomus grandis grandis TaxID=2921223 RepID=UPI002166B14F|nr:FK506-binding protein 5 [Anthonomus grandis grandis]XP_050312464.1 FK506-binding protein 5 [Anthonomus grandis grandis]